MENCSLRRRCLATDRAIQVRQLNLVPRVYTAILKGGEDPEDEVGVSWRQLSKWNKE